MTWQRAGRLGWLAPALAAALGAAFLPLTPAGDAEGVEALFVLTFVAYATVGALIVSRHPRNPIGWLFCAVGVLSAGQELLFGYASDAERPGAAAAAWLGAWTGEPATALIVLLLLLFPTGRFASPGWRRAGLAGVAATAVWALALALDPGTLRSSEEVVNPLGVEAAGSVLDAAADYGIVAFLAFGAVGVAGAVARFRASRGEERQQLKWLALAAGTLAAAVLLVVALIVAVDLETPFWDFVTALIVCIGLAAFPVAAGVAILRHRLYDIDVVIRRTLVYAALTATLGGLYLATVLLAGLAVGQSDLAVAASTLAVAALFRPARSRIQAAVDRRFYRRRYDASRTLEAFGGRLRDELDLEALAADLRGVVSETVQPAHVTLWLR